MGGGGSKWRKVAVGPPEAGECRKESCTEEGDSQPPGQGEESAGGQQRPAKIGRRDSANLQHLPGTTSEIRRKGSGSHFPVEDGNMDQELDRALAECEDWWLNSEWEAEPGSSRPPNSYTWTNSMSPCSEPAFKCTPSIQILAGKGGRAASRQQPEPLLGSQKVQTRPGQSQWRERKPAAPNQAWALSNSKLIKHRNHLNRTHDLFTISTQDIENNNLANGS
ncbi:uncharacterized protein [Heterodontus francisci]|uniref:uncharacterized protein isoform X2 n=1 Tax=Heterodontus francisci TaxID=7792 RepID=UPI00355C9409